MDKAVLVIKTDMLLKRSTMNELRDNFLKQIEQGCIIIPPWFECELIQVPENVEVRVEAAEIPEHEFLNKTLNT